MTDEIKLSKDASRGMQAQALLDNDLLKESFAKLEAAYIDAWRQTNALDTAAREKLFIAVNQIDKVKADLRQVAANGKVAAAELQAVERKRRLGVF